MIKTLISSRTNITMLVGAAILFAILPLFADEFVITVLTQCIIWGILAMSLDLMLGYTGLASLGHAAYFGAGAYTTAILSVHYQATLIETLLLGLLVAGIVTAIFALVALRASGIYFLMITFALAMLIWGLAYRWDTMTGGENGIAGIERPDFIHGTLAFHYFTLLIGIGVFIFFVLLVRSSFGKTLLGVRESESRMRNLGYNVWLHKYLIYLISGIFSGLAGSLWVYYNSYVAPSDVELLPSFNALLMVSLGGAGTLVGAMLGSTIFVFLQNFVNTYTERWLTVVGIVYIAVVLFAPEGIIGLIRKLSVRAGVKQTSPSTKELTSSTK
jgi:branched-chain amino acid transport system permease protein